MKKVFFVLAFMLTGTIVFANNVENKNEKLDLENTIELVSSSVDMEMTAVTTSYDLFGTCTVTVTATNSDGEVVGRGTIVFENVGSAEECDQIAQDVEDALNNM
ncbi:hypothetical protein EZY14_005515 [Kordia sp. TARA_039_SRF]|nr:hypothetical protein EZY14_005515 [Kordia sp. TARA_039_SRF]